MTKKAFFTLLTALAIFSSCKNNDKSSNATTGNADKPVIDLTVAKQEIEEANKNFMEFFAKGDSVGIANCYTTDAKLMFAGAPAVIGRAGIQTVFSNIIKSGVTRVNLETKEVWGTGDLLIEEGAVTVYVKDQIVGEEKSIVLWKKEDGKWKLFRDIANSNLSEK